MTSSPVVVLALAGKDVITISRKMMGATFGSKAEPGTIRGDYGVSNSFNLIHGSDSPEAAQKEIGLFFKPRNSSTGRRRSRAGCTTWRRDRRSKRAPEPARALANAGGACTTGAGCAP
jgi:hypothetical protein